MPPLFVLLLIFLAAGIQKKSQSQKHLNNTSELLTLIEIVEICAE